MDVLKAMRVFSAIGSAGSFSAAADKLGMSRAMASKYVQLLEDHLGARLVHRTTRHMAMTDVGLAYLERCQQIITEIDEAEANAARVTIEPKGKLRLSMPVSFSIRHIGPLLSQYMTLYPQVSIETDLSDRRVDLIEEGYDLAIRIGSAIEPGLIARRLATDRLVVCAAPSYLETHGTPAIPADLERHNCILYSYASVGNEWTFIDSADVTYTVKVSGSFRANNGDMLNEVVKGGCGIMCQPAFLVRDELKQGALVELLPSFSCAEIGIYAVYSSRKHLSAKVRTFVDYLVECVPCSF